MGTTDEPEKILAVLNNILEIAELHDKNEAQYLLGEISGLSETSELVILKKLHDEGVLRFLYYRRSNGVPYSVSDNFHVPMRRSAFGDRLLGLPPDTATKPVSATLSFKKAKLEKRKASIKIKKQEARTGMMLEKDNEGNFILDGKMLMTRDQPLGKETKHYKILDILYTQGDQEGKVSAKTMSRELRKRGEWEEASDEIVIRNVRNAMTNGLFSKVVIGDNKDNKLKNKLPGRKKIIETYKLKNGSFAGWKLNNPVKK